MSIKEDNAVKISISQEGMKYYQQNRSNFECLQLTVKELTTSQMMKLFGGAAPEPIPALLWEFVEKIAVKKAAAAHGGCINQTTENNWCTLH